MHRKSECSKMCKYRIRTKIARIRKTIKHIDDGTTTIKLCRQREKQCHVGNDEICGNGICCESVITGRQKCRCKRGFIGTQV